MGLLDDAIREHLDLKRRRGADPSEIAREEADALGPVRREADEEPPPVVADEPEVVAYDEPEPEPAPVLYDEPLTHDEPWAEPEEESATPPHGDPLAHQQTREFSATELDAALGEDPEAEADAEEDVLEETPDFLQETPEHDRLWFEQKPPKDFDF